MRAKAYTLRLPSEQAEALELLADAKGVPVVEELRAAVVAYLSGEKQNDRTQALIQGYPEKIAERVAKFSE